MKKLHPGFKVVQNRIARRFEAEGESHESAESRAGRILAARSRHASKAAKKANPRLNRVKG
jgi:hypothetical protein